MKTYIFYTDPGHGWLAVKRKELKELGILHQVSSCSYQNGQTVYLEEDCDAPMFLRAMEQNGFEHGKDFNYRESYQEHTPIRSYHRFSP